MTTTPTPPVAAPGRDATRAQTLPPQIGRAEAEERALRHLPGGRCVSSRLLHHPYAGFVFHLEQSPLGRRVRGEVHILVDLRSGAAATSEPWPTPTPVRPEDEAGGPQGPEPAIDAAVAHDSARQCLVRTMLHRRLSLRQPSIELRTRLIPLYKPNWLLTLRAASDRGTPGPASFAVLVDGLSGGYHLVAG